MNPAMDCGDNRLQDDSLDLVETGFMWTLD